MENNKNQTTTFDYTEGTKRGVKYFGICVLVGIVVVMIVTYAIGAMLNASGAKASVYQPETPAQQKAFDDWKLYEIEHNCEMERAIAVANMHDAGHGVFIAKDLNLIQIKSTWTCEDQKSIIPTAKALSFEISSFNTQDNGINSQGSIQSSRDISSISVPSNTLAGIHSTEHNSEGLKKHPVMIKGSPSQQQYIDYAWNTYHDKNLVYLLKAENGLITPDRKHLIAYYYCPKTHKKGVFNDWGFGGTSDCWHPEIVKDPRFFSDPDWQIDQVYKLYKEGTTFSSRPKWASMKQYFNWI